MIYIIIGLAILVIIFGYMALKMRLNHKLITKMSEDDLKLNTAKFWQHSLLLYRKIRIVATQDKTP